MLPPFSSFCLYCFSFNPITVVFHSLKFWNYCTISLTIIHMSRFDFVIISFMVPEWMKKMTNLWYPYILFRPTGFPAPKIMKIFGFPVFWIWKYLRNWQHIYIETKKNKTQYMLDTTMHKQTQITWISNEPSYK